MKDAIHTTGSMEEGLAPDELERRVAGLQATAIQSLRVISNEAS